MKYNPNGGYDDGYTIVRSYRMTGKRRGAAGRLGRGNFFAVALHRRADGIWICPGEIVDNTRGAQLANICYDAHFHGRCGVSLLVKSTAP